MYYNVYICMYVHTYYIYIYNEFGRVISDDEQQDETLKARVGVEEVIHLLPQQGNQCIPGISSVGEEP